MSVMTEKNGVSERKQYLSSKFYVFNIYFTSFYIVQEPLPSPSTSPQTNYVLDIADVMPDSISGFDLFQCEVFHFNI